MSKKQSNKKAPPNLPELGDRVKLRGRDAEGYLIWVNDFEIKKRWACVWWDDFNMRSADWDWNKGPWAPNFKICGYVEIEKIDNK